MQVTKRVGIPFSYVDLCMVTITELNFHIDKFLSRLKQASANQIEENETDKRWHSKVDQINITLLKVSDEGSEEHIGLGLYSSGIPVPQNFVLTLYICIHTNLSNRDCTNP